MFSSTQWIVDRKDFPMSSGDQSICSGLEAVVISVSSLPLIRQEPSFRESLKVPSALNWVGPGKAHASGSQSFSGIQAPTMDGESTHWSVGVEQLGRVSSETPQRIALNQPSPLPARKPACGAGRASPRLPRLLVRATISSVLPPAQR